jgi:prepilin-type N-terminal cleavage/methylation domain-containing protein
MKSKTLTSVDGFTLLEILVALAVMAIAVTIVVQLFSVNLRSVARAGHMTAAAVRVEDKMREILAEPGLTEKSWSENTEEGYQLDVSITEVLKERTDNLPVKLMEVTLTIHWTEGQKEKSMSLKSQRMTEKMTQNAGNFALQG